MELFISLYLFDYSLKANVLANGRDTLILPSPIEASFVDITSYRMKNTLVPLYRYQLFLKKCQLRLLMRILDPFAKE